MASVKPATTLKMKNTAASLNPIRVQPSSAGLCKGKQKGVNIIATCFPGTWVLRIFHNMRKGEDDLITLTFQFPLIFH